MAYGVLCCVVLLSAALIDKRSKSAFNPNSHKAGTKEEEEEEEEHNNEEDQEKCVTAGGYEGDEGDEGSYYDEIWEDEGKEEEGGGLEHIYDTGGEKDSKSN
jgi:hypothetical protein